jgi:hypothetical protein
MNIDEYRLAWEHVDKLTERRQTVTTTFISVNAAVVGAISFLIQGFTSVIWTTKLSIIILAISGIIACDLWRRLILQYSTLSAWWYGKLRQIESMDTQSDKLVSLEYEELYKSNNNKLRLGLTRYEVRLTYLFMIIFLMFIFVVAYSIFYK